MTSRSVLKRESSLPIESIRARVFKRSTEKVILYLGFVDIESIGDAIHGVQDGGGDAIRFKERVNGKGSMG